MSCRQSTLADLHWTKNQHWQDIRIGWSDYKMRLPFHEHEIPDFRSAFDGAMMRAYYGVAGIMARTEDMRTAQAMSADGRPGTPCK
jgi:hypothetical protein